MWFQYPEKLSKDSFRIFTLEPGEDEDGVQGSLKTHRLDAAPGYEALSYEWGSKTETKPMKCNKYDFKITQSLDITLRRLRLTDRPRSLWIDQICINQESYDERSAQVSIMRLIYSNADTVIAWLGPADPEAAKSVKDLLVAFINLGENYTGGIKPEHFPADNHLERLNLPRRDSRVWKDLNSMLGASYFSRVWIIQELAVASKFELLWGDITISEDEYDSLKHKIMFLCMTEAEPAADGCPEISWDTLPLLVLGKSKWEDKDLSKLAEWASGSKATIAQDKIYALIGLAGQRHYNVKPDYTKSESEVFADFATRVISTNENLNILDRAYVKDPNERERLPFWAPRWQSDDFVAGFVNGEFKASNDTKAIMKRSRDAKILELRGLEVGVVEDVHHREDPYLRGFKLHQDVAAALKIVNNHSVSFEEKYELDAIKVIILTMMAGREREVLWVADLQRADDDAHLDNFITFAATMMFQVMLSTGYDTELFDLIQFALEVRGPVPQDDSDDSDDSDEQDEQNEPHIEYTLEDQDIFDQVRRRYPANPEYVSTIQDLIMLFKPKERLQGCCSFIKSISISKGLNFFIMGNGYVGIGPRCMKAGDKVCILFGGSTPYVIRPTSITDQYLYLGPAYVHGIMDGEVVDAWEEDKDSENQEFREKSFQLL